MSCINKIKIIIKNNKKTCINGAHSNLYSYNLLLTCIDVILSNTNTLAATYRAGLFFGSSVAFFL